MPGTSQTVVVWPRNIHTTSYHHELTVEEALKEPYVGAATERSTQNSIPPSFLSHLHHHHLLLLWIQLHVNFNTWIDLFLQSRGKTQITQNRRSSYGTFRRNQNSWSFRKLANLSIEAGKMLSYCIRIMPRVQKKCWSKTLIKAPYSPKKRRSTQPEAAPGLGDNQLWDDVWVSWYSMRFDFREIHVWT